MFLNFGKMPEEEKEAEVENNGKFVKDILYIDSQVVGKYWVEDDYGKPAKGKLGTLILSECCYDDERVILLMGSDCDPEELMMEGEVLSDVSDEIISSDDELMTRSVVLQQELNADDVVAQVSREEEFGEREQNTFSQGASKAEMTNPMSSSLHGESKNKEEKSLGCEENDELQDYVQKNMISKNEVHDDAQENFNTMQQHSERIPYSGSISLRSTSSTASAQSFAFPILAQEWNSSPVRMAKPDKQLTKKRCWRMKLSWSCCKF